MSEPTAPADMKDYLEEWSPAEKSTMTANGVLTSVMSRRQATELSAIFMRHGWVVDQIHWETRIFHAVPRTVFDDE